LGASGLIEPGRGGCIRTGNRFFEFLGIAGVTIGWGALGALVVKLDVLPAPIVLVIWLAGFYVLAKVRREAEALKLWLLALVLIGFPVMVFSVVKAGT